MALETLLANQRAAAELMGVDFRLIEEAQKPRIVMEDIIEVAGMEIPVLRAHSGQHDNTIGKGGIRMAAYASLEAARADVEELSAEMNNKLALRGYHGMFHGSKGGYGVDPRLLDHSSKREGAAKFEHKMEDAGLAGYDRDVPAGDVGTNGLADDYALAYRERNPGDPYWQASITGKSPENGGLEFRTAATGWGTYVTQKVIAEAKGHDTVRTAIQGFGNVGAWHAHFASNDPEGRMVVNAISDREGTLATNHPEGLKITLDMVHAIGDNLQFRGNKIQALAELIQKNQPGIDLDIYRSEDIFTIPTDYFVPAAMGNVITKDNVGHLGARLAVVEAANGPTTREAHHYLVKNGVLTVPDILANGAGVDCSIKERAANISGIIPTTEVVKRELTETCERVAREVLGIADELGTPDLGVAAAGLAMVRLLSLRSTVLAV